MIKKVLVLCQRKKSNYDYNSVNEINEGLRKFIENYFSKKYPAVEKINPQIEYLTSGFDSPLETDDFADYKFNLVNIKDPDISDNDELSISTDSTGAVTDISRTGAVTYDSDIDSVDDINASIDSKEILDMVNDNDDDEEKSRIFIEKNKGTYSLIILVTCPFVAMPYKALYELLENDGAITFKRIDVYKSTIENSLDVMEKYVINDLTIENSFELMKKFVINELPLFKFFYINSQVRNIDSEVRVELFFEKKKMSGGNIFYNFNKTMGRKYKQKTKNTNKKQKTKNKKQKTKKQKNKKTKNKKQKNTNKKL